MNRSMSAGMWLAAVALILASSWSYGQDAPASKASPPAKQPNAKPLVVKSPYRPLAPGVLVTIDPMRRIEETVSQHDVVGLLAIDPKFDWAKDIDFHRDVWALKFQFKPMRMIWVDIPQESGFMERKLIWYMVYVVTNPGKMMHPVEDKPVPYETVEKRMLYDVKEVDHPVRFTPEFLLEGHQRMKPGEGFTKFYPDRVMPLAMKEIRKREDPNREFLTSVEMCRDIKVGESLWGVATWEELDPRIIRFSVYVYGLTNSYRWKDDPREYKPGESTLKDQTLSIKDRKLSMKALKLNFWRPSDPYFEREEEIRYGIPEGVDYEWVYR